MNLHYNIDSWNHSKILKKNCHLYGKEEYMILNCDSAYICFDEKPEITQYRSVILSYPEQQLCSFSLPMKKTLEHLPKQNEPDAYEITEFIEGPLIHLFYDHRRKQWEIGTKNGIGGYYPISDIPTKKKETIYIRSLFCDAFCCDSIHAIPNIDEFPKNHCYNFILQHPQFNSQFQHPTIYLVNVFKIDANKAEYIRATDFQQWSCFSNNLILFPMNVDFPINQLGNNEFTEKIMNVQHLQGILFFNIPTGQYSIVKSKKLLVKQNCYHLDSKLLFRFLLLKKVGSIDFYLTHYSFHKKDFLKCIQLYSHAIYKLYNSLHSSCPISYYQKDFQNYLTLGKRNTNKISFSLIKKYMNDMSVMKQYYLIHSAFRKDE
jgi:hypothetical protein